MTLERDGYRLSYLHMGAHCGTHMDAPAHFLPHGAAIDQVPLDLLTGPGPLAGCGPRTWTRPWTRPLSPEQSPALPAEPSSALPAEPSPAPSPALPPNRPAAPAQSAAAPRGRYALGPRLLIRGQEGFSGLTLRQARAWRRQGSGCWARSCCPWPKGEILPRYTGSCWRRGWLVESLDLSGVQPGRYRLTCLPLRVWGRGRTCPGHPGGAMRARWAGLFRLLAVLALLAFWALGALHWVGTDGDYHLSLHRQLGASQATGLTWDGVERATRALVQCLMTGDTAPLSYEDQVYGAVQPVFNERKSPIWWTWPPCSCCCGKCCGLWPPSWPSPCLPPAGPRQGESLPGRRPQTIPPSRPILPCRSGRKPCRRLQRSGGGQGAAGLGQGVGWGRGPLSGAGGAAGPGVRPGLQPGLSRLSPSVFHQRPVAAEPGHRPDDPPAAGKTFSPRWRPGGAVGSPRCNAGALVLGILLNRIGRKRL